MQPKIKIPGKESKEQKRNTSHRYTVSIVGEDNKSYSAEVVYPTRKLSFHKVKVNVEIGSNIKIRGVKKAVKLTCSCVNVEDAHVSNIENLVGTSVILRERLSSRSKHVQKSIKSVRGEIVSVEPYIVSTPPGDDDLPPIGE